MIETEVRHIKTAPRTRTPDIAIGYAAPWWLLTSCQAGWLAQYAASASAGGRSPVRCISRWLLYQSTQPAVIFTRPAQVVIGPSRNGDLSRVHSALYSPMVVSARALRVSSS